MTANDARPSPQALVIAKLNDRIRQAWGVYPNAKLCISMGIRDLPDEARSEIFGKVQKFDAFTEDNDPYGEHDFGAFDHAGERIFWKIDYYALDLMHGSEDPTDTSQTVRVLTIMLASEY